jgi:hypothetical protein
MFVFLSQLQPHDHFIITERIADSQSNASTAFQTYGTIPIIFQGQDYGYTMRVGSPIIRPNVAVKLAVTRRATC